MHDELGTNLLAEMAVSKGDPRGALARSPYRLQRRFYHHRYAAAPIECRGVLSVYDPRTDVVGRLSQRSKRIIWLNPEYRSAWGTGDSDMYRYAPFCSLVTVCNTLRQLERTITDILGDAA